MNETRISTILGEISVTVDERAEGQPIVFMHGVFLDKSLWSAYGTSLTGRTHVYIDMPAHGASSNVGRDWSLDECVTMLINILDTLNIVKCVVIGHSWGSMVALRAATKFPGRISALGLFNMPFKRSAGKARLGFIFQKLMVVFQTFYAKQAAKALYTAEYLFSNPEVSKKMQERLSMRPPKEISRVIDAVMLKAEDVSSLVSDLRVPALAIIGESDYVGAPPDIKTVIVSGGHISPHEAQIESKQAILKVINLATNSA
jgi:3-oxoadipate enol-lactonase